jgi:4a-hydroxytetrahydrobiopterin dehydratase
MSAADRVKNRELENILAQQLPQWNKSGKALKRTFGFDDFRAALAFVNAVGEEAKRAGHHPDIDIRYSHVTLSLSSHDAGGITWRDIALAGQIDALAAASEARKAA